jgi:hypothetical protein
MFAVEDGFKMQVAPCGRTRSANFRDDLPHLDGVPLLDGDPFQMVIGGDQPIAVVDLHAVAAAPRMPAHSPDHTGVGRIHPGAARSSKILAPVELARSPGQRADPEPEA